MGLSKILMSALAFISLSTFGCIDGAKITQQPTLSDKRSHVVDYTAAVTTDGLGVATAAIRASASGIQEITVSGGSAVDGTVLNFPPGALAVDTTIAIEEAVPVADATVAAALGMTSEFVATSKAVSVQPSVAMDAVQAFTVSLALPSGASLALVDDFANLVVMYKMQIAAENKVVAGIIPRADLEIVGNMVRFSTKHFGAFQAALTKEFVQEAREVAVTSPIQTVREVAQTPSAEQPPANTTQGSPSNPQNFAASAASENQITLKWTSGGAATSAYQISYQAGSAAPANCASGTTIASSSISGSSHTIVGLSVATTYAFRLCAVNASKASDMSSGVTLTAATTNPPPPPDVTNLSGVAESDSRIKLTWTSGGGATARYQISYLLGSVPPASCTVGTRVPDSFVTATQYVVAGLKRETQYSFRVCAANAHATSLLSAGATKLVKTSGEAVPPNPIAVQAQAESASQVLLSWSSGGGTTAGYRISYQVGTTAPMHCAAGTAIAAGAISGTSHAISGLSSGTLYSFRLCAINANGVPDESLGITLTATTTSEDPPPEVTAAVAMAASDSRIDLSWASGGGTTAGFRISYQSGAVAPVSCGLGTQIGEAAISGTSHVVTGLVHETQYSFRICAITPGGSSVSLGSIVSATTAGQAVPANPTAPAASVKSSSEISLSWGTGGGTTAAYRMSYQVGATAPPSCLAGTQIPSSLITGKSYQVTGLTHETQYSFRICAINANATADVSSGVVVSATTQSLPPPPNPVNAATTVDSDQTITLSWISGGGSTSDYRISYQAGATAPASCSGGTVISEGAIFGTSHQIAGLTHESPYSFRICAINANAMPGVSSGVVLTATTASQGLPPNPTGLTAAPNSASQVTLTWGTAGGSTAGYRISYQAGTTAPANCSMGTLVSASEISGKTHVVTGLVHETAYAFRVCAVNANATPGVSSGATAVATTPSQPTPPDPTGANAQAHAAGEISLSWSSGGGPTAGFRISYRTGATHPASCDTDLQIPASAITGTSHLLTGLTHQTQYSFRICAVNANATPNSSSGITASVTTPGQLAPPNPIGIAVQANSDASIALSWSSGGGTTAGYRISFQPGATAPANCTDGVVINEAAISGTSYLVTGLSASTQYTFRICAINANATPLVSTGVTAMATTSSTPPPPQVTGASTAAVSASQINLSWTSGGGTTAGYRIAYQAGATAPASCAAGTMIGEAAISGTSHSVTALTHETQYSFRICAITAAGASVATGVTVIDTTLSQADPLDPTGPSTTAISTSQIMLSWTSGGGTTAGYRISYQVGATAPASCSVGTQIASTSISGSSHVVTGLIHETQYWFRICAINANASPTASAGVTATATTQSQLAPPNPASPSATADSASQISLSWTSGGGTTAGYRISYQAGATAPASCATGTQISEAAVSGTNHAVTGLNHETQYGFRICAINANATPGVSSGITVYKTTQALPTPPNPTSPLATANSSSQITVSWTSGGGTTSGYRIAYQAGGTAPASCSAGTHISEGAISGTSHAVTGLVHETLYSFRICAINANGTPLVSSGATTSMTTQSLPAPPNPTAPSATANSASQITLSWASGGGTTSKYRIAYQAGASAPTSCAAGTQISEAAISGTSHAITGLTHQTQYSFRVCAINANSTPTVSAGVMASATTESLAAPPNPTSPSATANSASQITLSWTSGGGTTSGYRISYQAGASAPASCSVGTQISEGSISGTSHVVTGLTHETTYRFRICAINANSAPNVSSGVTAQATTQALAAPPNPANPTATANSTTQITLSWTSGGGTTSGYRISYQVGATAPANCASGTKIGEGSISGTSKTIDGLVSEQQYSFRICAINANASPNVSSGVTVAATTVAEAPAPDPVSPGAIASEKQVTLSWSSGGGTTKGYQISYQQGPTAPSSCADGMPIGEASIAGTFYVATELAYGTQYSFRICAINGNAQPDVSNGVTASAFVPFPVCGNLGNDCYSNSDAKALGKATTPTGKSLQYVFATGSSGFKIWKEEDGSRILQANGLDGWQKKLNLGGSGRSTDDFTSMGQVAGRVCPPNVYLDDANKFTMGNCLFYDAGNVVQALGSILALGAPDYLLDWTNPSSGSATSASWYEGNIKTCSDKGMRLPTIYETNTALTTSLNHPIGDGVAIFALENGVPSFSSLDMTWTASAATGNSGVMFWQWSASITAPANFTVANSRVRCVLP